MAQSVSTKLWKTFDWTLCKTAGITFDTIQFFNKYKPNPSFTPKWSDKPLLKSWEKSKPPLGWPRTTDSLCPECVKEARDQIMNGNERLDRLGHEKVGEVKAQIIERDGQVWMVKECPIHGNYEDMMAVDAKFLSGSSRTSPAATFAPTMTKPAQSRIEHHEARPRLGADRRPDQPLQHDVRSLLHGRQPGRLRARTELGRH